MLLKIIIAVAIFWMIINLLALMRRGVSNIQDEIFEATHHSIRQARQQHLGSDEDFAKEASKIEGFFGEQAYGRRNKIPETRHREVKAATKRLQKDHKKEEKMRHG